MQWSEYITSIDDGIIFHYGTTLLTLELEDMSCLLCDNDELHACVCVSSAGHCVSVCLCVCVLFEQYIGEKEYIY